MWTSVFLLLSLLFLLFSSTLSLSAAPAPSIERVSGCVDDGNSTAYCPTQSTYLPIHLTIIGQHFPTNFSSILPLIPYPHDDLPPMSSITVTIGGLYVCSNTTLLSSSLLLCILPNASYSLSPSNFFNLTVDFPSLPPIRVAFPRAVNYQMARQDPPWPAFFGLSGCNQTKSPVGGALDCVPGEVVTAFGYAIPAYVQPIVMVIGDAVQALNCSLALNVPSTVHCTLPDVVGILRVGWLYQWTICFGWKGTKYTATCSSLKPGLSVKGSAGMNGTLPTITRTAGCDDLGGTTQLCPLGGGVNVTVYGTNLLARKPQSIYIGTSPTSLCPILAVNDTQLVCQLPVWNGTGVTLEEDSPVNILYSLELTVTQRRALSYSNRIQMPAIIDVTGCTGKRGAGIYGCHAGMAITIAGYAFPWYERDSCIISISANATRVQFPGVLTAVPAQVVAVLPQQVQALPTDRVCNVTVSFASNLTSPRMPLISFANTTRTAEIE